MLSARIPLVGALVLAVAAGGCGSSSDNSAKTATQAAAPKPVSDSGTDKAMLWFTAGEQFHPVERQIPKAGSAASGAVEALLAGPSAAEGAANADLTTQIPAGTTLDKLTVGGDGTATVHVSPSFLNGIETDPAARDRAQNNVLAARLGQVTYTATQFADVKAARVVAGPTTPSRPRPFQAWNAITASWVWYPARPSTAFFGR